MTGYEVCYMDSHLFTVVALYKTEEDYNKDRPEAIYVITKRRYLKEAERRVEIIKMKYKDSKVELIVEKRGKDLAAPILDKCLESKRVVSPSLW
jgi:hypothetical protein